jgi:hypothetical protein
LSFKASGDERQEEEKGRRGEERLSGKASRHFAVSSPRYLSFLLVPYFFLKIFVKCFFLSDIKRTKND